MTATPTATPTLTTTGTPTATPGGVYDPAIGNWTVTGSLTDARQANTKQGSGIQFTTFESRKD